MKKLVLLLAVVFSVSMFACKSADNTEAAAPAEDAVVVEEEAVAVVEDTVPADSAAVEAPAEAPAETPAE